MDVHLRGLRCFVAVAEHLSFTRAAAALFVSQPTLSKQVRSLEDNLRVQLFARNRVNRLVRSVAAASYRRGVTHHNAGPPSSSGPVG